MKGVPTVFINVAKLDFEVVGLNDILDNECMEFNLVICTMLEDVSGKVKIERNSGGSGLLITAFDRPSTWVSSYHRAICSVLSSLFDGTLVVDFMVNQIGTYRFVPVQGKAGMIDSETFKEPASVANPDFVASLYKGGEVKLDVTDDVADTDERESRAPRNQHIRDQMAAMAANLDSLEKIHRHIMPVYPSDHLEDVGIAFEYEGLNYLVNIVEGEEDLAGVMKFRGVTLVGIFLHDNVFVTKGHVRVPNVIVASGLSPYDFNALMVNYATMYEHGRVVSSRQRIVRRSGRDRGNRHNRDRDTRLD